MVSTQKMQKFRLPNLGDMVSIKTHLIPLLLISTSLTLVCSDNLLKKFQKILYASFQPIENFIYFQVIKKITLIRFNMPCVVNWIVTLPFLLITTYRLSFQRDTRTSLRALSEYMRCQTTEYHIYPPTAAATCLYVMLNYSLLFLQHYIQIACYDVHLYCHPSFVYYQFFYRHTLR